MNAFNPCPHYFQNTSQTLIKLTTSFKNNEEKKALN